MAITDFNTIDAYGLIEILNKSYFIVLLITRTLDFTDKISTDFNKVFEFLELTALKRIFHQRSLLTIIRFYKQMRKKSYRLQDF